MAARLSPERMIIEKLISKAHILKRPSILYLILDDFLIRYSLEIRVLPNQTTRGEISSAPSPVKPALSYAWRRLCYYRGRILAASAFAIIHEHRYNVSETIANKRSNSWQHVVREPLMARH